MYVCRIKQLPMRVLGLGIRSEDAGVFGCLHQGEVDIVNAAYIKVLVRGRCARCPIDVVQLAD